MKHLKEHSHIILVSVGAGMIGYVLYLLVTGHGV